MGGWGGERVTVLKDDIVIPRAFLPSDEDECWEGNEAVTMATG